MTWRERKLAALLAMALLIAGSFYVWRKIYLPRRCAERAAASPQTEVTTLIEELESPIACIRSIAALDLQQAGKRGEPAIPALLQSLKEAGRGRLKYWISLARK